ncbi:S-protein homolog 2 [Linum grandiflorum]
MLVTLIIIIVISVSTGETVHVVNNLTVSNLVLIVHCHSADDDLHAHAVSVGAEIKWSFKLAPIYFAHTLFWCNFAVQDKRLNLDVYEEAYGAESSVFYWVASDDGIHKSYLNNGPQVAFVPWN